jgi:hypothetical protein
MRNGLNILLFVLFAACPPLFGQDETNATSVETNVAPYGNSTPMPAQLPPPEMQPMPRRLLPPSNLEQQRLRLPPRVIPSTPLMAPSATLISNRPIREIRAVSRFGPIGWTVEVCTNADDLTNGCLEADFRQAEIQ